MSDIIYEKLTNMISNPNIIQKPTRYETNQNTPSDIKSQDIYYFMYSREKIVMCAEHVHINFFQALDEMNALDWNYGRNYIGFINNKTNECVQFIRRRDGKWYAEVPIQNEKYWKGYAWVCYSDSNSIFEMMELFFDEAIWFHLLPWKMRRYKH